MGCLPSVEWYKTKKSVRGESRRAASIGGGGRDAKYFVGKVLLLSYNMRKKGEVCFEGRKINKSGNMGSHSIAFDSFCYFRI